MPLYWCQFDLYFCMYSLKRKPKLLIRFQFVNNIWIDSVYGKCMCVTERSIHFGREHALDWIRSIAIHGLSMFGQLDPTHWTPKQKGEQLLPQSIDWRSVSTFESTDPKTFKSEFLIILLNRHSSSAQVRTHHKTLHRNTCTRNASSRSGPK